MSLELAAVPLAFVAGVVSVLSPCVWPLVPVVVGSAAGKSRFGPVALAAGLSIAFALSGTLLSFALVSAGLNPELFRYIAAVMLFIAAALLLINPLAAWLSEKLSRLTAVFNPTGEGQGWFGQFLIGLLLGLVWLPCVGPTLGAAIALASVGQQLATAFVIMLSYGIGTAAVLLTVGIFSTKVLRQLSPTILKSSGGIKKLLGVVLLVLAVLVMFGWDKRVEAQTAPWIPDWVEQL